MSNKVIQFIRNKIKKSGGSADDSPAIIKRSKHCISRSAISDNTLKVLYRIKDAGFSAYLVGGGVRDILLKRKPKDFDVATDAHPEQVAKIFRNSRIIGRRFRLVHVYFRGEVIEVSTFRSNTTEDTRLEVHAKTGMIKRDNTYGTIEEDAWRRDFTVNALYYNIADFSVMDFTGGMQDLKRRQIRMIGDPTQRYHEDPVRLLRAIRLSAKLHFSIESATEKALRELPHLLQHVPSSRLFDELQKLFFEGNAQLVYAALQKYKYFSVLFPQTAHVLQHHKRDNQVRLIDLAMQATDERIKAGQSINPGFLLAVLLWPVLQYELNNARYKKNKFFMQLHHVIQKVMSTQLEIIRISKRFQEVMRSIWLLQFYLKRRRPKRINYVANHRYFRAAYDFMCLRVQAGEKGLDDICAWWKVFQESSKHHQAEMIDELRSQRK